MNTPKAYQTKKVRQSGSSNIVLILFLVISGFVIIYVWNMQGEDSNSDSLSDPSSIQTTESDLENPSATGLNDFFLNYSTKISISGVLLISGILIMGLMIVNSFRHYFKARKERDKTGENRSDGKMNEDGQAMTEFILIFPIILIMTTCIMQASLAKSARMIVNYAAFCSARAAIVWIPEPAADGEEPYYTPAQGGMDQEDLNNLVVNDDSSANEKMGHIRKAALIALIPAGSAKHNLFEVFDIVALDQYGQEIGVPSWALPDLSGFEEELSSVYQGILDAFGSAYQALTPSIARRILYVNAFTDVLLVGGDGSVVPHFVAEDRDPVTIEVRFLYHLRIPIANAIIGKHLDTPMAEEMGLLEYLPGWASMIEFSDQENYYAIMSERSTLLVERKFNHDKHSW